VLQLLEWRVDVLALLKESGYSTCRIRKEHIFAESTVQNLRNKAPIISWRDLETICRLTNKQPGKLIWYVKD
jgi:DNA-binding Xre family transcriptional regulator